MPESSEQVDNVFYLDLDACMQISIVWLQVGMKTYSWPHGWGIAMPEHWPARIDYRCSCGLTYGLFTLGLRHLCSHSVDPLGRITDGVDGSYNELFLRVESSCGCR